jgi:uncharacterized membrane protein YeaQ/YmgE (transglycosylase-associated protein family)
MDNVVFWVLMVGITSWLTGMLIGKEGYGRILRASYAGGLDVVLGFVGASIGGYLFFSVVIGAGGSFSHYAPAILGSAILVGVARLIPARYLPSRRHS